MTSKKEVSYGCGANYLNYVNGRGTKLKAILTSPADRRKILWWLGYLMALNLLLYTAVIIYNPPPSTCQVSYTQVQKAKHGQAKVLLVAYYRGGSSFFGKLFQSNEAINYWFEPLRSMQGDFKYHKQTIAYVSDRTTTSSPDDRYRCSHTCQPDEGVIPMIQAIFSCDITGVLELCSQTLAYSFRRLYIPTFPAFFDYLGKFSPLPYDIQASCVSGRCHQSTGIVAKTIRLRMRHVEPLLENDKSLKVIYYSRDPRGIMSSLVKLGEVKERTIAGMCGIMEDDYESYLRLKQRFPQRVKWMRYEDLAMNPYRKAVDVYNFTISKTCLPDDVHGWIKTNTNAKKSDYNGITGTRRNSSANAVEWQQILPLEVRFNIEQHCKRVLHKLKYFDLL